MRRRIFAVEREAKEMWKAKKWESPQRKGKNLGKQHENTQPELSSPFGPSSPQKG
jgi:hypothetical protein